MADPSRTREVTRRLAEDLGVTCDHDGFASLTSQRLAEASSALAQQLRDEGRGGPSIPFAPSIGDLVHRMPSDAARGGGVDVPVLVGTTRDESELFFRHPAIEMARALTSSGSPVWLYRFDGVALGDNGGLGSCHASDLPFIFDTVHQPQVWARIGRSPSRSAVATMHDAWTSFCVSPAPRGTSTARAE